MALKQLILSRKISAKRSELEALRKAGIALNDKRSSMKTREDELEESVNEITPDTEQAIQEGTPSPASARRTPPGRSFSSTRPRPSSSKWTA